jgi:hypothetical protein
MEALKRRLKEVKLPTNSLFSYQDNQGKKINLTRAKMTKTLEKAWTEAGYTA